MSAISPVAKFIVRFHNRLFRAGERDGFVVIYDRSAMWRSKPGRFGVSIPISAEKPLTWKEAQAALDSGEWGNISEMNQARLKSPLNHNFHKHEN